jgi:hypothetical protein
MTNEPTFWRVEGTSDILSPDNDTEDRFGFEPCWEVISNHVTEHHHATAIAERALNNDGFYAVRLVSVWVEERSQPGEALRRMMPASLVSE